MRSKLGEFVDHDEKIQELLTDNEYQVTVKFDPRPDNDCYVVFDENYVGFGEMPEEALGDWIGQLLEYGPPKSMPNQ